jgi:hypothetical protein
MDETLFMLQVLSTVLFGMYLWGTGTYSMPLVPRTLLGLFSTFSWMITAYTVNFVNTSYGWVVGYWYGGLATVNAVLVISDAFKWYNAKDDYW